MGRIGDHLDLPWRERLVSADQRAISWIPNGLRPRGAQTAPRLRTAVSHGRAGAWNRPGLDRPDDRECRELEHPCPATGESAEEPCIRLVRRHCRNRPLVRSAVHQYPLGEDGYADPLQHRDAAGPGATTAPKHVCGRNLELFRYG